VGDLNPKHSPWWADAWASVLLGAVTLGVHTLSSGPLQWILPRVPNSDNGLGNLFGGLAQDPWAFVLFVGPLLLIPWAWKS